LLKNKSLTFYAYNLLVFLYRNDFITGLVGYTIWKFYIKRDVKNDYEKKERRGKGVNSGREEKERSKYDLRNNNSDNNSQTLTKRNNHGTNAGL